MLKETDNSETVVWLKLRILKFLRNNYFMVGCLVFT